MALDTDGARLHTAARRYCMERYQYWTEKYANTELNKAEAIRCYPRYQVINAILVEVERFDPKSFLNLEEARSLISIAGHIAEDAFTLAHKGNVEQTVMSEERKAFRNFVENFPEE